MQGEHRNSHNRREDGCQHRTENTESERKNKNIVKDSIKQAAGKHTEHGQLGTAVVLDKGRKNGIGNKCRRKEQHHAEIGFGHLIRLRFGTEQRCNRIHEKDAEQRKAEARKQTAGRCRRVNLP